MKLLKEATFELSNAIDLIVEFSELPRKEVLNFPKVRKMVETLKELGKQSKISRPKALVKHTQGEWTITGETANMIIVKAIHQNGKRTVAKIPFTTEAQDEKFGMTDHHDAKLIKNAPKLKQIAEMYFDDLSNDPNSGSFLKGLISEVLTDINE